MPRPMKLSARACTLIRLWSCVKQRGLKNARTIIGAAFHCAAQHACVCNILFQAIGREATSTAFVAKMGGNVK